jgi:hypothetical protein
VTPPREAVVDTMVVQKANAPLVHRPRSSAQINARFQLLLAMYERRLVLLVSKMLLKEYETKVPEPRNDYVKAFLELAVSPGRAIVNWAAWSGARRENARRCRFPREDVHLLRTAIRPQPSLLFTEEKRILNTQACVHRLFHVRICATYS